MTDILDKIFEVLSSFGLKLIIATLILVVGKLVIKLIKKALTKILKKQNIDEAVLTFVTSLTVFILWLLLFIIILSQLGIQTTSFITVLGAAGLAIGLAIQGALSNFAAGFLMILFRPFKEGDLIEVNDIIGRVCCINLLNTELKTIDNRRVIIPNSQIMNEKIINITSEENRRVDLVFSVSYDSSTQEVKNIISDVILKHEKVLLDTPPIIRLFKITHSSLDFAVRVWCKSDEYWNVYFDLTEQIRDSLLEKGINQPMQRMVLEKSNLSNITI
jgi:small conductance mechanosensitive channel